MWTNVILILCLAVIQGFNADSDICYCTLRPNQHTDLIELKGFESKKAYLRGARCDQEIVSTTLGRVMRHKNEEKCGHISLLVDMETTPKAEKFVHRIILKMQRDSTINNIPQWIMMWNMIFTFKNDNDDVDAWTQHLRMEYVKDSLPGHYDPTPRGQPAVEIKDLPIPSGEYHPFEFTDIPESALTDAGPMVVRRESGQVMVNYWETCGWKIRFARSEIDITISKSSFEPLTFSLCGPCGDNWQMERYTNFWLNGIENLRDPFRSQVWLNVNSEMDNIQPSGEGTASREVPQCDELTSRMLEHDDYCGIIIDSTGPFKECYDKGHLFYGRAKAWFLKCKRLYCEATNEDAKQTLCDRMETVEHYCQEAGPIDCPWRDSPGFSHCT